MRDYLGRYCPCGDPRCLLHEFPLDGWCLECWRQARPRHAGKARFRKAA